jgi:hypothetical protein
MSALDQRNTTIFGYLHRPFGKSDECRAIVRLEHLCARHAVVREQAAIVLERLPRLGAGQPIAEHRLGREQLPAISFSGDFGHDLALSGR